ncbi:Multiple sugar-binding protein precursor [compost metagenome]
MKKSQRATCVYIFVVLGLLLSGCIPKPDDTVDQAKVKGKVVLTFWDENAGPSRTPILQELLRRFEQMNPDIQVKYEGMPAGINKAKYDLAVASGDLPDAGGINGEWIADYAAKGVLLPLDAYFADWPERGQIDPSFIDYNRSLTQDGKLYQIPSTYYLDVFWYRSDWFAAAGLPRPQTWEDIFRSVRVLANTRQGSFGYSLRGGEGSVAQLTSLMYAYSGITDSFRKDGSSTVNDPVHIEFLKRYLALYKAYTPASDIVSGYKEVVANFDSGRAAMIQHNLGSYQDHKKALGTGHFDGVLLPPSMNGIRTLFGNANGYGIMRTTRHPDEAWRLIRYLLSEESQIYWNSQVGQIPTNLKAWNDPYFLSHPVLREAIEAFRSPDTAFVRAPYELPDYPSLIRLIEPEFQQVLAGTMDVEHFLNFWAQLMENSRRQHLHSNEEQPQEQG